MRLDEVTGIPVNEVSNELLGRYKKAAGADASKADKEGDFEKGNKRFSGIVKATKKQFKNDQKKSEPVDESRVGNVNVPVSTIDPSAPWIKKGMERAGEITKTIRSDIPDKEKFDFLYKGKVTRKGISVHLNVKPDVVHGMGPLDRINFSNPEAVYDPSTGEALFTRKTTDGMKKTFKVNSNNFVYTGREKSIYSSQSTVYKFETSEKPVLVKSEKYNVPRKKDSEDPVYTPPVLRNAFGAIIKK